MQKCRPVKRYEFHARSGGMYLSPFGQYVEHDDYLELLNELDSLRAMLGRIINDLPSNKDWLDPVLEAMARAALSSSPQVVVHPNGEAIRELPA